MLVLGPSEIVDTVNVPPIPLLWKILGFNVLPGSSLKIHFSVLVIFGVISNAARRRLLDA